MYNCTWQYSVFRVLLKMERGYLKKHDMVLVLPKMPSLLFKISVVLAY